MNREQIYSALYAKLAGAANFVTTSRKLRHWDDVGASEQPALFVVQKSEVADPQPKGVPTKWTLDVNVYIYVRSSDVPSSEINPLLDSVTAALLPDNPITNAQTLGGLVHHCWIEGQIETDEGLLGDQSVCIIPVRILAT